MAAQSHRPRDPEQPVPPHEAERLERAAGEDRGRDERDEEPEVDGRRPHRAEEATTRPRNPLLSSTGMDDVAAELRTEVERALPRLRAIPESRAAAGRGPGKWVRKEILGHLVDSAANNLQRFVRARLDGRLAFPDYRQDEWVSALRYRERPWAGIVDLWAALNGHVAHAIASTPNDRLAAPCAIPAAHSGTMDESASEAKARTALPSSHPYRPPEGTDPPAVTGGGACRPAGRCSSRTGSCEDTCRTG